MPWFGNFTLANTFADQTGYGLGMPNQGTMGPEFAYAVYLPPNGEVDTWINSLVSETGIFLNIKDLNQATSYAVLASGVAAPEIDGSLAPKVGFLLGCLFLMFGHKKRNTELILST